MKGKGKNKIDLYMFLFIFDLIKSVKIIQQGLVKTEVWVVMARKVTENGTGDL